MKKILFIVLGLLMVVIFFGQDLLIIDFIQMIQGDIVSIYNVEFFGFKLEDVIKVEGDSVYIRNDFVFVIQIYELFLCKGELVDVYYNFGNSYYKINEIVKVILNYEKVLLFQFGNGDICVNLEIVCGKIVDKVEVVFEIFFVIWIKVLINSMSVDLWVIWGIVSFLLLIVFLYFFIFLK